MADAGSSIFNKKATEKLRSPDDLDKYVRVTNPSVWVILAACIVLVAGLVAWGVFGTVSTDVVGTGACVDGEAMCLLSAEKAQDVNVNDEAVVGGQTMKVSSISKIPLSRSEASAQLGSDYLMSTLMDGDWAYLIEFEGDTGELPDRRPFSVSITTDRVAPITLVLGGEK